LNEGGGVPGSGTVWAMTNAMEVLREGGRRAFLASLLLQCLRVGIDGGRCRRCSHRSNTLSRNSSRSRTGRPSPDRELTDHIAQNRRRPLARKRTSMKFLPIRRTLRSSAHKAARRRTVRRRGFGHQARTASGLVLDALVATVWGWRRCGLGGSSSGAAAHAFGRPVRDAASRGSTRESIRSKRQRGGGWHRFVAAATAVSRCALGVL